MSEDQRTESGTYDVLFDQRRLLLQRPITKRMTQQPPIPRMIAIIHHRQDTMGPVRRLRIRHRIFQKPFLPIDIFRRLARREYELVGRDADHGAVGGVEGRDGRADSAGEEGQVDGETGGAVDEGTGEVGEGVEEEVVDDTGKGVE